MSKGGSTSSATEIPAWLENAAIKNINRADDVSQIGYTPYYGPDVAAFSPMQQQAMQATGGAASAFGLAPQGFDAMAGMPQAQEFAGGIQGYSSAPLYEQSLQALQQNRPAQYEAITGMFIDPITGEMTGRDYRPTVEQVLQSNYAQGGDVGSTVSAINQAPDYIPATDGGTGYWQGGDQTATQTNNLSDEEFEAYVLAHGLPEDTYTTGDALRGIGGNLLDSSLIGRVYEGLTGDPLAGGSPNAPVTELSNADAFPIGSDYSTPPAIPTPIPSPAGDWGYDDDYSDPKLWDFSQATAPTAQVETAGGLLEQDLQASLAAEEAEMSRQAHEARMAKAKAKAEADAKADKEAKAKAEAAKKSARAKAEEAIQRQLAEEEAFNKAEAKKAQVRAKQAADAKAAKAKAKAEAKKRAEYLAAEEAKKAKAKAEADAKAKAKAEADRKAKLAADRKAKLAENERINAEAKRVADALEKQTRELAAKKAAEIKAKQAADAKAAKAKAKAEAKKRADYLAAQRAEQAPAPAPTPYKQYSQANALAAKNGYAGVSGGGGR